MANDCMTICVIMCISAIIVLSIMAPIFWSIPNIYIQDVYVPSLVPGLNKTTTTFNTSVFIDFKFKRKSTLLGFNYLDSPVNIFYGKHDHTPVGSHMIPGFHMSRKKRVLVKAAVEASGMPWQEAIQATSDGNAVVMAVELVEDRGYANLVFKAHVRVDASGHMVSKNSVQLFCGKHWWWSC